MGNSINLLDEYHIINESWQNFALCSQSDPDVFFPDKGGSLGEAKAICKECEVRYECLNYALQNNINYGIWGGTSERERKYIKKVKQIVTTSDK